MLKLLHIIGLTNLSKHSIDIFLQLKKNGLTDGNVIKSAIWSEIFSQLPSIFLIIFFLALTNYSGFSFHSILLPYNNELLITVISLIVLHQIIKIKFNPSNFKSTEIVKKFDANELIALAFHEEPNNQEEKTHIESYLNGKKILVTGAGGIVGSSIAEEITLYSPVLIVLYEHNESSLNRIYKKLSEEKNFSNKHIKVLPILGSVCDDDLLDLTLKSHSIDTVYHAATDNILYLNEWNDFVIAKNNIFGTYNVAKLAHSNNISHAIFISSVVAADPRDAIGVLCRTAELVFHSISKSRVHTRTKYTSVRLDRFYDSYKSEPYLIAEQVINKSVVKISHPEFCRYYISRKEAAHLALAASAFSSDGQIAVIEGKPMVLRDLAIRIIEGQGYSLKNEFNPDGDIEIQYIGLGAGQKLYEERIYYNWVFLHSRIPFITAHNLEENEFYDFIKILKDSCDQKNWDMFFNALERIDSLSTRAFSPNIDDLLLKTTGFNIQAKSKSKQ